MAGKRLPHRRGFSEEFYPAETRPSNPPFADGVPQALALPPAPVDWLLEAVKGHADVRSAEIPPGHDAVLVTFHDNRRLLLWGKDKPDFLY
jgi:hypothetical protein